MRVRRRPAMVQLLKQSMQLRIFDSVVARDAVTKPADGARTGMPEKN